MSSQKPAPIRDGYACPECEQGTVRATRFQNYHTKFKGYPFTVAEAWIGVCDTCGARIFSPKETQRWNELFVQSLQAQQATLSAEEVAALPKQLGLSITDFALLIGATRQSMHNWTRTPRKADPTRTADLMLRLVSASARSGSVDVIAFLLDEAKKWGLELEVQRMVVDEAADEQARAAMVG